MCSEKFEAQFLKLANQKQTLIAVIEHCLTSGDDYMETFYVCELCETPCMTHLLKAISYFYMDLSKAFDSLSHDILLNKLTYYGVKNSANDLLRSYLSNRKQYVQHEESLCHLYVPSVCFPFINVLRKVNNDVLSPLLYTSGM